MALKFIKAATAEGMARAINGIITGKRDLIAGRDQSPTPAAAPNNLYKHPVNGLTLIFTAPAGTVTFVGDRDYKQILADIAAVIGAGQAHLWKVDVNGGMVLSFWDDTTPMVLSHLGTANAYFGFATGAADPDLTQSVINPANIKSMLIDVLSRQFITFYT